MVGLSILCQIVINGGRISCVNLYYSMGRLGVVTIPG